MNPRQNASMLLFDNARKERVVGRDDDELSYPAW